jgi:hypothetical protein
MSSEPAERGTGRIETFFDGVVAAYFFREFIPWPRSWQPEGQNEKLRWKS